MAQPVVDTLEMADELKSTGMEQDQAEGLARALGTQLGEHVVVRKDLETGFESIRARMDKRFGDVDMRFVQVDARFVQVDARFVQLEAQMDKRFGEVDKRFGEVDGRLGQLQGGINALGVRLDALAGQFKFMFAVSALLVAMLAACMGMVGVMLASPPAPPTVVVLPPSEAAAAVPEDVAGASAKPHVLRAPRE